MPLVAFFATICLECAPNSTGEAATFQYPSLRLNRKRILWQYCVLGVFDYEKCRDSFSRFSWPPFSSEFSSRAQISRIKRVDIIARWKHQATVLAHPSHISISSLKHLRVCAISPLRSKRQKFSDAVHRIMSSSSPSTSSDTGPQTCDLCGRTLSNSSYLARHKNSTHGQKYYPCEVTGCDFATTRQDSLTNQ
jgi:hypothetical protein